jgi:hypothetical protein
MTNFSWDDDDVDVVRLQSNPMNKNKIAHDQQQ